MTNLEYFRKEIEDTGIEHTYKYFNGLEVENVKWHDVVAWLCAEHKEPLLNDGEKEWLCKVQEVLEINIDAVRKKEWGYKEYLEVKYHTEIGSGLFLMLPPFGKDEKFKNLKVNEKYTLKELEL